MPVKFETSGDIELDMLHIIASWAFVLIVATCLGAL